MSRFIYFCVVIFTALAVSACGFFSKEKESDIQIELKDGASEIAEGSLTQSPEIRIISGFFDSIITGNKSRLQTFAEFSDENIEAVLRLKSVLNHKSYKIKNHSISYEDDTKKVNIAVDVIKEDGVLEEEYVFFLKEINGREKIIEYVKL